VCGNGMVCEDADEFQFVCPLYHDRTWGPIALFAVGHTHCQFFSEITLI